MTDYTSTSGDGFEPSLSQKWGAKPLAREPRIVEPKTQPSRSPQETPRYLCLDPALSSHSIRRIHYDTVSTDKVRLKN